MTDQPQQLQFYYIRMKSDEQALDQMYYSVFDHCQNRLWVPLVRRHISFIAENIRLSVDETWV